MKNKFRRRLLAPLLLFAFVFPASVPAKTDGYIFSDPVANVYLGRAEANPIIDNMNFSDLPADANARDAIVRNGVLNMVKAYEGAYSPSAAVTKEQAVAFALRAVGMEEEAQAAGVAQRALLPADSPLRTVWSIGYLFLARNMGLITPANYADAMAPDPSALTGAAAFIRTAPATREETADWLARALQYAQPDVFATTATQQNIYNFTDWASIAPERVNSVENLLRNRIMGGEGARFNPKGAITRQEAAHMLRNMDILHYNLVGLQKMTGTVAGLTDAQGLTTAAGQLERDVYVRNADGLVDVLVYTYTESSTPQDTPLDATVLRGGAVAGLAALAEGDEIEYLVEPATGTVWYVQVTGGLATETVRGRLEDIDTLTGTLTVTDETGKEYRFVMADGLYGQEADGSGGFIKYDNAAHPVTDLPVGALYDIRFANNIVTAISYAGDPVLTPETRGIVLENAPDLGYLTIREPDGAERTYNYNTGDLRVQKREYYDMRDTLASIHSLFPDFIYNPRETDMSAIEPGDIVSFRADPADPGRIASISAAVSYTTRYGRVREVVNDGEATQMLMEFDNGQTAWFTVADGVMVMKGGRPSGTAQIVPGDWARLLVNQAIITPGYMMESVKEVQVDSAGHAISAIVKGRVAGFNPTQNQLNLQDAQTLNADGWSDYRQIGQFALPNSGTQYFYDGQPVNLSYIQRYLSHADLQAYVALEGNYAGDRVRVVSLRSGRDELLAADTVIAADGAGGFTLLSNDGAIATDAGTIVRKNGRLVVGAQIDASDYAVAALTGEDTAAVVDITPQPATSGVLIGRGRVYSVDEGQSFKVSSIAMFDGQNWNYTPVQREFVIDRDTVFIDDGGARTSIESFLGYGDDPAYEKVYTIVLDGGRAARVLGGPYAESALRGTVYAADGETVQLNNVHTYDNLTGRWTLISSTNATTSVTVPANAVVVDRNQVVGANSLQVGQQIKVMTDVIPDDLITAGVNGYVVLVER